MCAEQMNLVETAAVHFLDAGFIREKIQELRVAEFQQMRLEASDFSILFRVNKFVFLVARLLERPGLFGVALATPHANQRRVEHQILPGVERVDRSGYAAGDAAQSNQHERQQYLFHSRKGQSCGNLS